MHKILFIAILSFYSIVLSAQSNPPHHYVEFEQEFNRIQEQLKAQPNNINLLLERTVLIKNNLYTYYDQNDFGFNFQQYKIEDLLKDTDYLIDNINTISKDITATKLDLLLLKFELIDYTDTLNLDKVTKQLATYIKTNQSQYPIETIDSILDNLKRKYILNLEYEEPNAFFTIERFNQYNHTFNTFFPIELSTAYNKDDSFMIYELMKNLNPITMRHLFVDNIELNNRKINYYKKLILYTYEASLNKKISEQYDFTDDNAHYNVYDYATKIAKLYYTNKDYKNAKLWMQTLSHDDDKKLVYENTFNTYQMTNNYFYKELLNIALEEKSTNLDKQFFYIFSFLNEEYIESLDSTKHHEILQVLDILEPRANQNPTFFYLKAYALFNNRYYHLEDYKNYTNNIFALLDKANALGLNNASMDFIRGAIYKELNDNTLANQYFDKAIKANPDKYTLPAQFYGDPDISYLIDKALGIEPHHSNIENPDYSIPKSMLDLAKLK